MSFEEDFEKDFGFKLISEEQAKKSCLNCKFLKLKHINSYHTIVCLYGVCTNSEKEFEKKFHPNEVCNLWKKRRK